MIIDHINQQEIYLIHPLDGWIEESLKRKIWKVNVLCIVAIKLFFNIPDFSMIYKQ